MKKENKTKRALPSRQRDATSSEATDATRRIDLPLSKADLEHYESHLVLVTAMALAKVTDTHWIALAPKTQSRWLDRSLALLHDILADRGVIERLPLLVKSLSWRLVPSSSTRGYSQDEPDPAELADILTILARSPAGDNLSIACFLVRSTNRLEGRSPLEALCKGDRKSVARVKQLAVESLE